MGLAYFLCVLKEFQSDLLLSPIPFSNKKFSKYSKNGELDHRFLRELWLQPPTEFIWAPTSSPEDPTLKGFQ